MSVLGSFNIGVTGLHASGTSMSVIGDNIANAGTFGFKKSRPEFQDTLARSLKGIDGGDQIGTGTRLAHVTPIFTQGIVNRTESITDLAINGNGFFAVETDWGRGFTRDGAFHFNKEGQLINGDGYTVLGFQANKDNEITTKLGEIEIGATTIPSRATEKVTVQMNLDSREEIQQFNPQDPDNTSNFNSSITVYDNIGTQRVITMYFNKTADSTWEYHAMVDGADAQGGQPGTMVEMATGQLIFSGEGVLQQEISQSNSFNFNKGAKPNQQIEWNFGESIVEGGDGVKATTQYGSESSIARHFVDGNSAGTLGSLSFNDKGILTAVFTNGVSRDIAQIAVAKFENNEGLFKMGKNLYKETKKSGQAAMGRPNQDGRGEVLARSIEFANVDIADEFIGLMTAQRNFQANTKTIATADSMLQEVLGLKR
jgi:flagellar hook protein FlgE